MKTLLELAAELRRRQKDCEHKAEIVKHLDYVHGLMKGYAAAYELSADLVDAAIMQQRVAEWDNLIAEMYDPEVQA